MKKELNKISTVSRTGKRPRITPKAIEELPAKKNISPPVKEEELMESEKQVPEIEKTHKHIHKIQSPTAAKNLKSGSAINTIDYFYLYTF